MKTKSNSRFGFPPFRFLLASTLFLPRLAFPLLAVDQPAERVGQHESAQRDLPTLGQHPEAESSDLDRLEQYWSDRLTYPTGNFDPAWVRKAADQDSLVARRVPSGLFPTRNGNVNG